MDIDIVLAWVNGNDPAWIAEKRKYENKDDDDSEARYRDWIDLRYWFRCIETNAPWVRKIHFVTWGHIPEWLDTDNGKLNIVKHSDFIPEKYLPTFSSHAIELNFHRIKGLAEHFVYFNDDMYLCKKSKPTDFFRNGMPRDVAALNVHCYSLDRPIQMISVRDVGVINKYFTMNNVIKKNLKKWFCLGYGNKLLRTLPLMGCPRFPGFYIDHTAQSFLKATYSEVWNKEPDLLDETCIHKFRQIVDVNQWLMKEWQIASGKFEPRNVESSKVFHLTGESSRKTVEKASKHIIKKDILLICINDGHIQPSDVEYCKTMAENAFQKAYPEKSSFEK